jgi:hypothetical protein
MSALEKLILISIHIKGNHKSLHLNGKEYAIRSGLSEQELYPKLEFPH